VYKYPVVTTPALPTFGLPVVRIPQGAQILDAQLQGQRLFLWALIDPGAELVGRQVHVVGTGWEIPPQYGELLYVSTFQDAGFVWHVFLSPEPL
jgi:hypothetical protein